MCCAGQCPNCLVAVDGAPGVRACTEPAREGMRSSTMNASPSLDFDVMRATDLFGGPFTPPGFYYKTFIRPRRLWPLYEKVLRRAAGLGRLRQAARPTASGAPSTAAATPTCWSSAAASPASRAAIARRRARRRRRARATRAPSPAGACSPRAAHERARELAAARARGGRRDPRPARRRSGSSTGSSRSGRATRCTRSAPPASSSPPARSSSRCVFPGNDLPGVMLSGGARRLAALYAVQPGQRGGRRDRRRPRPRGRARAARRRRRDRRGRRPARDEADRAADALPDAGVEPAARHDRRRGARQRRRRGRRARQARRRGRRAASARVRLRPARRLRRRRAGDLAAAPGRRPHRATTRPARPLRLEALPDGVYAAGEVAGDGRRRGRRALGRAGGPRPLPRSALGARRRDGRALASGPRRPSVAGRPPPARDASAAASASPASARTSPPRTSSYAVDEGYDSIELSKRYTTVTMGPCQGRMCQLPSVRLMAQRDRADASSEVGTTTARPPWSPVPLGALAGRPVRAGQALGDPRPPPRAGRDRHVGRRLAARLRLRRPARARRWPCTTRPG